MKPIGEEKKFGIFIQNDINNGASGNTHTRYICMSISLKCFNKHLIEFKI